jgi:gliding motility-associated-like protein
LQYGEKYISFFSEDIVFFNERRTARTDSSYLPCRNVSPFFCNFEPGKSIIQDQKKIMKHRLPVILLLLFLGRMLPLYSQTPAVVVSSYYNSADPRDEWSELLVVADNTNMTNWIYQDNNSNQTQWQPSITFSNPIFWDHMRAGTVIIIWHRQVSSSGVVHTVDVNKNDGYVEVAANDPAYFSGGNFGTNPLYAGPTLNLAAAGDVVVLQTSAATFVHALGHKAVSGVDWNSLPSPKLNQKSSIANGDAVFVCPGSALNEYGTLPPQDGTTWTSSGTVTTFGLPNACAASGTANSDFWRSLRQPAANPTSLVATVNSTNTQVILTWNAVTDPYPSDGTMGYMISRSTFPHFGNPVDGHTYLIGNQLSGTDTVIALIGSSQTLTYTDNVTVPCGSGYDYRIYAYRYGTDDVHGNDYNSARGRAYNETLTPGTAHASAPAPVAPVTASTDRNNFCADDAGNITLSATGGSGTTLNWYTVSCGGTLLGAGSGPSNSITIPSPAVTTTYYARWENNCGASACATVTVTVLPLSAVSVTISAAPGNTVCAGTSVTFTATPVNPGTAPSYQWKVNGINAGTNSSTFTYVPVNGDNVNVVLTSNASCVSGNPTTSNTIVMTVSSTVPLSVTVSASPGDSVCAGTTVTFAAIPVNGGSTPSYQWFLNGNPVGGNIATWSNVPVNGDNIYCKVTSSLSCATNNPANSNTVSITITAALPVSATVTATPGDTVCAGTTVIYTVNPVNGGANPGFEWFLNGTFTGGTGQTWASVPADGDKVSCRVTSSFPCAAGNPAISDTLTMSITSVLAVTATITAAPGDTVCSGTMVTYNAVAGNGGANPTYQWFYNGSPVGSNSSSWSNVPVNGDVIRCEITSAFACATNNPATSNTVTIVESSGLPVLVSITATPGDTVCAGTTVTFTATAVNGGLNPVYQWYLNGSPAGVSSPSYSLVPADGDAVYCIVTSALSCAVNNPATSSTIVIIYTPAVTATVTITADHPAICPGTVVTFTASATNEGGFPDYEWLVNGTQVQQGSSPTYTTGMLTGGESVTCILTSSLPCLVSNPVQSAPLSISAAPAPVVNLSDLPYLCAGNASQLDAGPGFKSYLWQDGSTGRYFMTNGEGVYRVTVTDSVDCTASDSVQVKVCDSRIYVPDAFTPNGDGLNDEFRAVTDQEGITGFSMVVYNRWGQLIFESSDVSHGWNGMAGGKYTEPGAYAWKIVYQVTSQGNSESTTLHGTVLLIR